MEYALPQELEAPMPIHGPLDALQPMDMSLDWPLAPAKAERGEHRIGITTQLTREAREGTRLGGGEPGLERVEITRLKHPAKLGSEPRRTGRGVVAVGRSAAMKLRTMLALPRSPCTPILRHSVTAFTYPAETRARR